MDLLLVSWPTLIVLGVGLRMALRLHYGVRGPAANDSIYNFVAIISWVLILLALVPAILGSVFTVFGLIILRLAATTLVEVVTQSRLSQRRSVCAILTMFLQRKLLFDGSFILSPQAARGRIGRSAKKLFADLNAGVPLAVAAQSHQRALPPEAAAYIAAGDTLQCEAAALQELSQVDDAELMMLWRACIDRISYLSCVLVVMCAVLTFVIIKIIPAYVDIFEEFSVELPAVTRAAVVSSDSFMGYFATPTVVVMLLLLVGAFVLGVCELCDMNILRSFSNLWFRGRTDSDVLRILAVAAEQRQPFPNVLARIAQVYPSSAMRYRLAKVAQAVRSGVAWQNALESVSVISSAEAALVRSAEPTGSLPWALREVAARRQKRGITRLTIVLQVLYPIAILLLGGLVGFYVVALFVPIVRLIDSLI